MTWMVYAANFSPSTGLSTASTYSHALPVSPMKPSRIEVTSSTVSSAFLSAVVRFLPKVKFTVLTQEFRIRHCVFYGWKGCFSPSAVARLQCTAVRVLCCAVQYNFAALVLRTRREARPATKARGGAAMQVRCMAVVQVRCMAVLVQ